MFIQGQKKVEDFLQSPYFQSGLSTISGARESLEILRTKFDLVVVTCTWEYVLCLEFFFMF